MLPKDPVMCLSVVNTKLRDEFENFDELCHAMDEDIALLLAKFSDIGYHYDVDRNQFV